METHAGTSLDDFLREENERDPEFAALYEETRIEGDLALALARRREECGLSQRALAAKSGIKQPMIARIERAGQTPTTTTLWRLLSALDAVAEIRPDGVTVRPFAPTARIPRRPTYEVSIPLADRAGGEG
ncbi:MAG: helix-turn-helix domain-containing protein [Thermomicrobiales bacterium]